MTLTAYLAGSSTGLRVKIGGLGLTTSADGSVGIGSIIFDDPDGTLLVRSWMKVIVEEDACIEAPVLFSGYVLSKRYSRSDGSSTYRAGKSRYIHANLLDENAVLHTRLITGLDGKRPAETRNDRLQWLLESAYLDGLIEDTSLVSSGEENFEEASYLGQYPDDVLMDISAPINRIFFVYLVQPDGDRGLFFDRSTATIGDSTLSISNDPDDESSTCFYPLIDAELEKDGSEVYDNGRYKYKNGVVLGHNDDTKAEFFTDNGLLSRGINIDNSRVGQESTARTFLARILDRDSSENDTVTVTITVPAEQAGLIQAGHRVPIKFVHLEVEGFGGEDFVYSRVTELTLTNAGDGTLNNYDIAMRLNTKGLPGGGGGGAPGPGEFPHPTPGPGSIVQTDFGLSDRMMPNPIADGNMLVYLETARVSIYADPDYTATPLGETYDTVNKCATFYRVADGDAATLTGFNLNQAVGWYELAGVGEPSAYAEATGSGYNVTTAPVAVNVGDIAFMVATIGQGGGFDAGGPPPTGYDSRWTPGTGWVEDLDQRVFDGHPASFIAHRLITTAGTITGDASFINDGQGPWPWGVQVVVFPAGHSTEQPPDPGQEVPWAVVDMTLGDTFSIGSTAFPYANSTLKVKVDGVLISPASYEETDPACGLFTLLWVIDSDEVVTVSYDGR